MWSKLAVLAVLATVKCTPVPEYGAAENFVSAVSECIEKDTSVCLKVITVILEGFFRADCEVYFCKSSEVTSSWIFRRCILKPSV